MITNNFTATDADIGEVFQWEDGNTNNEDRVGYFVTVNGNGKILLTLSQSDNIIGITSETAYVKACAP